MKLSCAISLLVRLKYQTLSILNYHRSSVTFKFLLISTISSPFSTVHQNVTLKGTKTGFIRDPVKKRCRHVVASRPLDKVEFTISRPLSFIVGRRSRSRHRAAPTLRVYIYISSGGDEGYVRNG